MENFSFCIEFCKNVTSTYEIYMQIEHYSITEVSSDMTLVMQECVNLILISYEDDTFLQNDIANQ
jgi:hypothetical protein